MVSGGRVVISVPTVTLPSTARLLTQVARLPVTVTDAPFGRGWLNNVNLSPGTRLFGPRFFTVSVPPVAFRANAPLTTTESFAGEANLLISNTIEEASFVKSLLIVRGATAISRM